MSYQQLVRLELSKAGWSYVRNGKGSHEVWGRRTDGRRVVLCQSASRHTANRVLKVAGIPTKL